MTKFMMPAKFSNWRIIDDSTMPMAPSIKPVTIRVGSRVR